MATKRRWPVKPSLGQQFDPSHPLSDGLVSAWLLNECGGNSAFDIAFGNHGTLPSSSITWAPDGVDTDGTLNGITVPDASSLQVTGAITVEAIFVVTAFTTQYSRPLYKFSQAGLNDFYGYQLVISASSDGIAANEPYFGVANHGVEKQVRNNGALSLGVEYHVVGTYDGVDTGRVYVNGKLTGTTTGFGVNAVGVNTVDPLIGVNFPTGRIKKVALYSRCLTQSEVEWLYVEPWAIVQSPNWRIWASALLFPSSIPSAEAFGTAAIYRAGDLYPTSIDSGEAWGTPSLAQTVTLSPSSIASAEAWGTPALTDPTALQTLYPSSIPSAEAWGTGAVARGGSQTIVVTSILSGEAIGFPTLTNVGAAFVGLKVYLSGTIWPYVKAGSVNHTMRAQGRGEATLTLQWDVSSAGALTTRPTVGQGIRITENGRTEFSGYVNSLSEELVPGTLLYLFKASCTDLAAILDQRIVMKDYPAGMTVKAIVIDIVANYLAGDNITTVNVVGSGTVANKLVSANKRVSAVFDDLSKINGELWRIDPLRDLHFELPGTGKAAPFSITDGLNTWLPGMVINTTLAGFADSVILRSDQNLG